MVTQEQLHPFQIELVSWETQEISGQLSADTLTQLIPEVTAVYTVMDDSEFTIEQVHQLLSWDQPILPFVFQGQKALDNRDAIKNYLIELEPEIRVRIVKILSSTSQQLVLLCDTADMDFSDYSSSSSDSSSSFDYHPSASESSHQSHESTFQTFFRLFYHSEAISQLLLLTEMKEKEAGSNLVSKEELNNLLSNSSSHFAFSFDFMYKNVQRELFFSYSTAASDFVPAWMDDRYMATVGDKDLFMKLENQKKLLTELQDAYLPFEFGTVTYKSLFVCRRTPTGLEFEIIDLYGVYESIYMRLTLSLLQQSRLEHGFC